MNQRIWIVELNPFQKSDWMVLQLKGIKVLSTSLEGAQKLKRLYYKKAKSVGASWKLKQFRIQEYVRKE
jgi:hypothetical protein